MRNSLFISYVFILLLLIACKKKEIDLIQGSLYCITTTEGDGFAIFERLPDDHWRGIYYLSKGQLMADKHIVDLEINDELMLVDESGKEIPIINYRIHEEPVFKDYPDTWTYKDSIYKVSIKEDEVYGKAQGYWVSYPDSGGTYQEIFDAKRLELERGKKEIDLTMDVYLPDDNNEASRPLLVLIHGGAFFNGDKADMGFPEWAKYFAGMGYLVASVNYRLGFRLGLIKSFAPVNQAGFYAVQDVDAAIRFIIHHQDLYGRVDPDRVFVAGTSAGGITALNVAFMRDANIPPDAQETGGIKAVNPEINESYSIRAVGNMWGAVSDLSILNNSTSSVISFHSSGDPVVPYGKGHPFESIFINWLLFPTMYGSEQITEFIGQPRAALKKYDLPGRHTLHVDQDENGTNALNSRFYEIETVMRDFFSGVMLPSPIDVRHSENSQAFSVSSSDMESLYWHVEGGAILKQKGSRADVLLFPDVLTHYVLVCGKYRSGLTFRYKWNL